MTGTNRKRLARLVAVAGVALLGAHLLSSLPREVEIRYAMGEDHRRVREARIAYVAEGEEMKGVRFHYAHGAPGMVSHRIELPPGDYAVRAHLRGPELSRAVERRLSVPADGLVHIDLEDR